VKRKAKRPQPISGYVVNAEAVALAMLLDRDARRLLLNASGRSHAAPALRHGG
jgi:hypothetical protein